MERWERTYQKTKQTYLIQFHDLSPALYQPVFKYKIEPLLASKDRQANKSP